jgi:uncharacterized protein (UPF0548 family)
MTLNFEPRPLSEYTPANGWHADALTQALPGEAPGPPEPGGAFAVAARLVRDYAMADPALVRARFDPETPLLGRVMTLRLRFHRLLSVQARVAVTHVWDEEQLFGFEYATLPGHVEMGRMDYQVHKDADSGRVEFRLHAHSRASREGPWWARLGFRLVGRREQLRFYRRCCERIAALTARELGVPADPPPPAVQLAEADAPETAELAERLLPRRTHQSPRRRSSSR